MDQYLVPINLLQIHVILVCGLYWAATGPLGAVGALGPLGTIGATGLVRNPATGQFTNTSGNVVRSLSVPYNGKTSRSFDVYENYAQKFCYTNG